jgi:hypothetical protein
MNQPDLFAPITRKGDSIVPGVRARDAGLSATLAAERAQWLDDAFSWLRYFASTRREFTAEEFRDWWIEDEQPPPHSHHVWGALFRSAATSGLIRHTGRYRKAASVKTHAHPVAIWEQA